MGTGAAKLEDGRPATAASVALATVKFHQLNTESCNKKDQFSPEHERRSSPSSDTSKVNTSSRYSKELTIKLRVLSMLV